VGRKGEISLLRKILMEGEGLVGRADKKKGRKEWTGGALGHHKDKKGGGNGLCVWRKELFEVRP